jgi:hypothetical protein
MHGVTSPQAVVLVFTLELNPIPNGFFSAEAYDLNTLQIIFMPILNLHIERSKDFY